MLTQIYWIALDQPGALGIMPRPRGGDWLEDEIAALVRSGVTTLVSLLEPAEEEELDLVEERTVAAAAGIEYVPLPMPDRGVPTDATATLVVVEGLAMAVESGHRVVVHCRQGIGRAALVACAALIRLGIGADDAMAVVGEARGREVPETEEQVRWLRERAAILRSGGRLPSGSG
jgi:protein-tyrosine phosphatase